MALSPSAWEQMSEVSAIDHLPCVGDVGRTTSDTFLRKLLPHCTAEQLEHIETETAKNGRNLTSITDDLWRKHYGRRFGDAHANEVEERLRTAIVRFAWRLVYKAKLKEQENLQTVGVDRLRELYQLQNSKKRQVQMVDNVSPEIRKRRKARITVLVPAGRGRGGSSQSKPSLKKMQALEAGIASSSDEKRSNDQVVIKQKPAKQGGPERGRLWKKSLKDFKNEKMRCTPRQGR